jgi:hypothetical protein
MTTGSALQRFARRSVEASAAALQKCDLCTEVIRPEHRHLLESTSEGRQVACVCQACALLFAQPAASLGRYRLIPQRFLNLVDVAMSDAEWNSLHVPVGLCFITGDQVYFPGALGPTAGALDQAMWLELTRRYPILAEIEPDLEALLVNRARGAREYFIVPIDSCFQLVAIVRTHWRGLSGGKDVWAHIDAFVETLRKRSRVFTTVVESTYATE